MAWFENLSISRKLLGAFLLVGVFTVLLGVFAIERLSTANKETTQFQQRSMPAVQAVSEIRAQLGEFRTFELGLLARFNEPDAVADYQKRMRDVRQSVATQLTILTSLDLTPAEKSLVQSIQTQLSAYFSSNEDLQKALSDKNISRAQEISDTQSRAQRRALFADLKKLTEHEQELLAAQSAQAHANYRNNVWLIVSVLGGIVLVSVVLSLTIARGIVRSLRQAVETAQAVARGEFNRVVHSQRKDETGALLNAMEEMTASIDRVISEQNTMDEQHRNGLIDHRIDVATFPGRFKVLAESANSLVDNHIGIKMSMVDVLEHYAQGDFTKRMRQLPNKQANITNAMESARGKLLDINGEIQKLVQAAAAGDFSARGDAQRFDNDFRGMITSLNTLMSTTESNLNDLSTVLNALARGDLTVQMNGTYQGVFAQMQHSGNETVAQLTEMIQGIQDAAQSIGTAAAEISMGNNELSARTEQQAANLEETAASMEELTSTVRQNADNAHSANVQAVNAQTIADKGLQAVLGVADSMREIEASAAQMRDIVGVIDRLAFQTNILSLNAAVEAARAGESGKGFAVVAGEIRSLAQSSAESAKDIRRLIDSSTTLIAKSSQQSQQAGGTIEQVQAAVSAVREKMDDISVASREQSSGIEQVNTTVVAMDEVTQQNAAMVEEAAAPARSLEEQSQGLLRSVGVFKTTGRTHTVQSSRVVGRRPVIVSDNNWQEF